MIRSILRPALCAATVLLLMAPTAVERSHPLFINGHSFGNAVEINGVLAISVQDLAQSIGGTTNLQEAGIRIQSNTLNFMPAVQTTARDAASGLPTGKRMHKPFVITKELDKATPLLSSNGRQFVAVSDVAKMFGGTLGVQGNLASGAPVNLNFAPSPMAALRAN
ncbi:MAG TPA: type VI secretion system tube protein Hcp [Thermoanaerobaculia bacterium]|nr:type VI secretion system tube protein Hcp [Thermoanaerobaculia bacterium]